MFQPLASEQELMDHEKPFIYDEKEIRTIEELKNCICLEAGESIRKIKERNDEKKEVKEELSVHAQKAAKATEEEFK